MRIVRACGIVAAHSLLVAATYGAEGLPSVPDTTGDGAPAQLSEPDTTAPTRADLPVFEPQRIARTVEGVHLVTFLRYATAREGEDVFSAAVPGLVDFVSKAVDVGEARFVAEDRSLAEPDFANALVAVMTGNRAALQISPAQKTRLGQYLKTGGVLYAEDVRSLRGRWPPRDVAQSGTPFDRQLRALVADSLVLGRPGRNWRTVPKDHPVFRAYFTFSDGPPLSSSARGGSLDERIIDLDMLEYRGRLAVLFSELNISAAWADPDATGRRRALQFGANVLVYAVAQYAVGDLGVR